MEQHKIILIVQARCTSERLPNKVLLPLGRKRVIDHVLTAAKASSLADTVILATTTSAADDPLAQIGEQMGVRVFRGSEHDVLGRFMQAIAGVEGDVIIRNTADDPLLDPRVIDTVIGHYLKGSCDYASNIIRRSWPRGMDTEVFSRKALTLADQLGTAPEHREHVTIFMRTQPELFTLKQVQGPPEETWPDLRLCVDTTEDYQMLQAVFQALERNGRPPPVGAVVDWLKAHPEVAAINAAVQQRIVLGRQF
jgi:spore coat polysaccharide biosynthesis protein SpsF